MNPTLLSHKPRTWHFESCSPWFALAFVVVFVLPSSSFAQSQGNVKVLDEAARTKLALRIPKPASISIYQYRKDADAYVIKLEAELDVGPNTTTLSWLIKAVDNGMSEAEIRKSPAKLEGTVFQLKNDLWLLSNEEIAGRIDRLAKSRAAKSKD